MFYTDLTHFRPILFYTSKPSQNIFFRGIEKDYWPALLHETPMVTVSSQTENRKRRQIDVSDVKPLEEQLKQKNFISNFRSSLGKP